MTTAPDDQIEDTVQRLAELHDRHQRRAGPFQRAADRVTAVLGRPVSVVIVLMTVVLWMVGNDVAADFGVNTPDRFPFPDLGFAATIAALFIALLILTTQRHDDEIAKRRAQLTLQIAVLSERKLAKIIALLEEQRHDNPMLASRIDAEAERMARPADPAASLARIEETHPDG